MLRQPREQRRSVARWPGLHHELVLIDQSQLRQRLRRMEEWHTTPPAVYLGQEPGFDLPLTPQSGDEDAMPTMLHLGNPGSHASPRPGHPGQEGATISAH